MTDIKYFEVDMSNAKEKGCYSMCIKAIHKPTKREAKKFLADDMKMGYTRIDAIIETTLEDAKDMYDMENETNFPVLQ